MAGLTGLVKGEVSDSLEQNAQKEDREDVTKWCCEAVQRERKRADG